MMRSRLKEIKDAPLRKNKFYFFLNEYPGLLSIVILFFIINPVCHSQKKLFKGLTTIQDTTYVQNYSNMLTTRIFTSRKFANFTINDNETRHSLKYRPNDNLNLGLGVNYSVVGINIGINFPFINNDDDVYGETKFLDLQSHIYLPKLAIDIIGQFYKGFYLSNSSIVTDQPLGINYIRPDILTRSLGLSMLYVFNDKKFSYRSFFLQNEWQKKSAGSLLLGGGVLAVTSTGDSSLFPSKLPEDAFFHKQEFRKIANIMVAVNGGYAYTFVVKSHWFLSLSFTGGTGWGSSVITDDETHTSFKKNVLNVYGTFRTGVGYNSRSFFTGISYVHYSYLTPSPLPSASYTFNTGNLRFNVAYRFKANFLRKKIKEVTSG